MSIALEVQPRVDPNLMQHLERILANRTALRLGSTGEVVREVNRLLGLGAGKEHYDQESVERAKRFQDAFYLKEDGKTGHATLNALLQIREVQAKLGLIPDGIYKPEELQAATRAFQTRHKLTVDGIIGPETLAKLAQSPALTPPLATLAERLIKPTSAEPDALPKPPSLETIRHEQEKRAKEAAIPKLEQEKKERPHQVAAKPPAEKEEKKPEVKKPKEDHKPDKPQEISQATMFSFEGLEKSWQSLVGRGQTTAQVAAQGDPKPAQAVDTNDLLIHPSDIWKRTKVWSKGKQTTIEPAPIGSFVKADGPGKPVGTAYLDLEPAVAMRLLNGKFRASHSYDLPITEAWRANQDQAAMANPRSSRYNPLAAQPRRSDHESGRSVDISRSFDGGRSIRWMNAHGREYGFVGGVPGDPYHFTYYPERASPSGREQIRTELGKITRAREQLK